MNVTRLQKLLIVSSLDVSGMDCSALSFNVKRSQFLDCVTTSQIVPGIMAKTFVLHSRNALITKLPIQGIAMIKETRHIASLHHHMMKTMDCGIVRRSRTIHCYRTITWIVQASLLRVIVMAYKRI